MKLDRIVILFIIIFSSWLMFHTFSYDAKKQEIQIAYKLWSDFGAHIPLIRSFSMGDNLQRFIHGTVEYPIFPSESIRYHFLFYMVVGILEKLGVRIDWALNIPSIIGLSLFLTSLYILAKKLFSSRAVALLTLLFFLFNGSLGFIRFFSLHPISLTSISDIVSAHDFPAFAPWGPGEISAFWNLNIYTNQRHLAAAFAILILFILTCLHIEKKHLSTQLKWAVLWGLIFGALPYFHQPTLLIVAIIMATYMIIFPKLRIFLLTSGLLTTILVVPQLLMAHDSTSLVQWFPGYIIHNEIVNEKQILKALLHMVSFWYQNLGFHSILILIGFFIIPKRARLILLPIIPLFIIPNLFKFSVEVSANHKFFNLFMALGSMISAFVVVRIFKKIGLKIENTFTRGLAYSLVFLFILLLTLTGIIDFFVVANDTFGGVTDIPKNEIATWISKNTPKNALFLNSSYLYHPASMAGRFIFLGWPYFAWSAGYKINRMPLMDHMYESRDSDTFCMLLSKYNITYVTAEDVKNDTNLPDIDLTYYLKTYKPVFVSKNRSYAIFETRNICRKK
jgi:hypothetical protein